MGKCARDHQLGGSLAIANLSIQPIDPTLPWTEPALLKDIHKELDSLLNLPSFIKADIRRDKCHFSDTLS
jgi:hypothetical protein